MEIKNKFNKGDEVCFFTVHGFSIKTIGKFIIEEIRLSYKDDGKKEEIRIEYYGNGIGGSEENLCLSSEIDEHIDIYCNKEIEKIEELRKKLKEDAKKEYVKPNYL